MGDKWRLGDEWAALGHTQVGITCADGVWGIAPATTSADVLHDTALIGIKENLTTNVNQQTNRNMRLFGPSSASLRAFARLHIRTRHRLFQLQIFMQPSSQQWTCSVGTPTRRPMAMATMTSTSVRRTCNSPRRRSNRTRPLPQSAGLFSPVQCPTHLHRTQQRAIATPACHGKSRRRRTKSNRRCGARLVFLEATSVSLANLLYA